MTPTEPPPPRLLSVRLQGFKSFAGRTHVEFGPGISAVVGPNGSGKSNLADALRWTLGEQGRSLRTRKSEDVIWAGSDRRPALGMADVALVLDNADGLLNVDFAVVELGRRLYRSGENDYLLNRQRVRLRDLVELLDGAHLAENAFLFIGQGMVDQALALRPEERRPLFEEVAGVRRHERRRRKAEEQLAESEANLARIEDILGELRPQAKRLAAQAEQQATRETAANDLAAALVAAAHARWHEAARRVADAEQTRDTVRREADRAMTELATAETAAGSIAAEMSSRVATEVSQREAHDRALAELTELRVREARLDADADAVRRDRERMTADRAAVEQDLDTARRALATPAPARDRDLDAAVAEAEAALQEALAELATLRAASRARGEEQAALRRAEAAREAEAETARRRLADAERRAADEGAVAAELEARRRALETARETARIAVAEATAAEGVASERRETARLEMEGHEAAAAASAEAASALSSRLAALRGRLDELEARLTNEEIRGIARAARRRGGRRVDEEIEVDPELRPAVQAALAGAARAYVVERDAVGELTAERGMLVVEGRRAGEVGASAKVRALLDAVEATGGGRLAEGLRRDPVGAAGGLLARAVWLPDLAACVALQDRLPSGWVAVPRDGSAVVTDLTVTLGGAEGTLEWRAEAGRLAGELRESGLELERLQGLAKEALAAAEAARSALATARAGEANAEATRRRLEDAERIAARELEATLRESAWHAAQAERLAAEMTRLRAATAEDAGSPATESSPTGPADETGEAVATWESRATELRARRDRLAGDLASHDAKRQEIERRRASAEAAIALDERRLTDGDRALAALAEREQHLATDRRSVESALIVAVRREEQARRALAELRAADADSRQRLGVAEAAAMAARERLRRAEDRLRAAERGEFEARLGLDALREQLLVELAGLGELGLRHLVGAGGPEAVATVGRPADERADEPAAGAAIPAEGDEDDAARFERALQNVVAHWAAETPLTEAPAPGRLASLRRRFHELGAANPFAVSEYEALRTRLDDLDSQEADLRMAIARTRELIDDLNKLIATQFRTTFQALEAAFDARFQQLFGGGFARLSLTEPNDLSSTGVEIVARPPGKKAQALAMLSGGERALTAVALLFAMLEVRPVPFCVLDEVDAALDEANIGRFTSALRELARNTQFVVITHNRGTIEAADALYGVTVGDDSVSRVISLRLDEARSLAGERAGAPAAAVG